MSQEIRPSIKADRRVNYELDVKYIFMRVVTRLKCCDEKKKIDRMWFVCVLKSRT